MAEEPPAKRAKQRGAAAGAVGVRIHSRVASEEDEDADADPDALGYQGCLPCTRNFSADILVGGKKAGELTITLHEPFFREPSFGCGTAGSGRICLKAIGALGAAW